MSKILNILRKDIRALYIEILLVLAATVAFVWVGRPEWLTADMYSYSILPHLNYSMGELLQFLRCLLIARLIHQEPLIGDRRFWITRPYSWRSLLAAKALFLLLFVVAPGVCADCALLGFAGFPPMSYVPQLLAHQALLAALLIVPFFAIAAVTRNLWQFAAPSICLFALWFLVIRPQPEAAMWFRLPCILVVISAAALTVIWLQYARRRTAAARIVMIGAVAAVAGISMMPFPDALVSLRYAADRTGVALAFDTAPFEIAEDFPEALEIPLKIAGLPEGVEFQLDGARVRMEAPGGKTADSGWQLTHLFRDHDKNEGTLAAYVDRGDLDALKWTRVNVRVTVALTLLYPRDAFTYTLGEEPLAIPGIGNCRRRPDRSMVLRCLSPFRTPLPLIAGAAKLGPDCILMSGPVPPAPLKERQNALALAEWARPRLRLPWMLPYLENISLNPVVMDSIEIGSEWRMGGMAPSGKRWEMSSTLCAGTEVVVTTLRPGERILRDIEIHNIRPGDYWPRYAR